MIVLTFLAFLPSPVKIAFRFPWNLSPDCMSTRVLNPSMSSTLIEMFSPKDIIDIPAAHSILPMSLSCDLSLRPSAGIREADQRKLGRKCKETAVHRLIQMPYIFSWVEVFVV